MKNVGFSILILFLVEIITCESEIYGFGLGSRYEGIYTRKNMDLFFRILKRSGGVSVM